MIDERYGVKSFHHPDLVRSLQELSPENELLELIDAAETFSGDFWEGSARNLKELLVTDTRVAGRATKLLEWGPSTANLLSRLKDRTDRVTGPQHTRKENVWRIKLLPKERDSM